VLSEASGTVLITVLVKSLSLLLTAFTLVGRD